MDVSSIVGVSDGLNGVDVVPFCIVTDGSQLVAQLVDDENK
jgi:hypothetical protein